MLEANGLDKDTKIYRALLRSSWIDPDTNTVFPLAFYLRLTIRDDGKREKGLSVLITENTPGREDCQRIVSLATRGVCSLKVSAVEEQGLTVEETRDEKGHILGLPYQDESEIEAKDHAELLASKSLLESQWKKS